MEWFIPYLYHGNHGDVFVVTPFGRLYIGQLIDPRFLIAMFSIVSSLILMHFVRKFQTRNIKTKDANTNLSPAHP